MIKDLLAKYRVRPNKTMGQFFLTDQKILEKIISASNIKKTDIILEIGPGIGTLTKELGKNAGQVITVEKDKAMCQILKETLADYKNIKIINADIRYFERSSVLTNTTNYKVIANIPYYLTSPLIRQFLESKNKPEYMVLMVQKEVAQRIVANPPKMSLLAVSAQFYADVKIISYVSKNCFWPAPKIDSAIIKLTPRKDRLPMSIQSIQLFFKVVKAGFAHPRKQLAGNLLALSRAEGKTKTKEQISAWLIKNNISPTQRAETLSIKDWKNLASTVDNS